MITNKQAEALRAIGFTKIYVLHPTEGVRGGQYVLESELRKFLNLQNS